MCPFNIWKSLSSGTSFSEYVYHTDRLIGALLKRHEMGKMAMPYIRSWAALKRIRHARLTNLMSTRLVAAAVMFSVTVALPASMPLIVRLNSLEVESITSESAVSMIPAGSS